MIMEGEYFKKLSYINWFGNFFMNQSILNWLHFGLRMGYIFLLNAISSFISSFQLSFIPGRRGCDNVVLVRERHARYSSTKRGEGVQWSWNLTLKKPMINWNGQRFEMFWGLKIPWSNCDASHEIRFIRQGQCFLLNGEGNSYNNSFHREGFFKETQSPLMSSFYAWKFYFPWLHMDFQGAVGRASHWLGTLSVCLTYCLQMTLSNAVKLKRARWESWLLFAKCRWIWKYSSNGLYDTKSAYTIACGREPHNRPRQWTWIWKISMRLRTMDFVWLCCHRKVPTTMRLRPGEWTLKSIAGDVSTERTYSTYWEVALLLLISGGTWATQVQNGRPLMPPGWMDRS